MQREPTEVRQRRDCVLDIFGQLLGSSRIFSAHPNCKRREFQLQCHLGHRVQSAEVVQLVMVCDVYAEATAPQRGAALNDGDHAVAPDGRAVGDAQPVQPACRTQQLDRKRPGERWLQRGSSHPVVPAHDERQAAESTQPGRLGDQQLRKLYERARPPSHLPARSAPRMGEVDGITISRCRDQAAVGGPIQQLVETR